MEHRYDRLVELAGEHQPCSVRHLYYQATQHPDLGIAKTKSGYLKVQRAALNLRRESRIPYAWIVDNSRTLFQINTFDSPQGFLTDMAGVYRRDLWRRSPYRVEVWCESDSIAGTLMDVTSRWRVPLYPIRGQSSETFAYNGAQSWTDTPDVERIVYYVGDHDPAGLEIEATLKAKLTEFADEFGVTRPWFERLGVTWDQAVEMALPGTTPKKDYGFPLAVEAEALPPRQLRELLNDAIAQWVDGDELSVLLRVEREEREGLQALAASYAGGGS